MRILLIGANGQLGSDLVAVFRRTSSCSFVGLTHEDVEICSLPSLQNALFKNRPDVVINTAAFLRVDACEDEVEHSFAVNATAVRNLALLCQEVDCTLVHFSSDYVFSGDKGKPYTEEDPPHPINTYGVSKAAGEFFVQAICKKYLLIRTSGLYGVAGSSGKGGNFVETMLRLAGEGQTIRVVDDQVLSPTYTADLAIKIHKMLLAGYYGLYHITNQGHCSWYQFAQEIFRLSGLNPELTPVSTQAFGAKARRPAFSVLENRGLERIGVEKLRPWQEALAAYLEERRGHQRQG